MKKKIFFKFYFYIFFFGVCIGQNPFTIANDNASNYSLGVGVNGLSQGSGFGSNSWMATTTNGATAAIYTTPLSNKSFYITTHQFLSSTCIVSREFNSSLSANEVFSVRFASNTPEVVGAFSISLHDYF